MPMDTAPAYSANDSSYGNNSSSTVFVVLPSWSVTVFITYSIVIMILGVTGNGVILVVEACNKHRSSTDWLVTFMSVNDLILAGCNTPIYILLFNGSWSAVGSDELCGLMNFVQETCSFSSTLLLTVTAIDRYMKTSRPHSKGLTPKRALYVCVGVTMFTLMFCMPIPFFVRYDELRKCRYDQSDPIVKVAFLVLQIVLQATFLIMFLVVFASYCKIAHTIRVRVRIFTQSGLTPSENLEVRNKHQRFLRRNKVVPAGFNKANGDCIEQSKSRNRNDLEPSLSMAIKSINSSNISGFCVDTNQTQQTSISAQSNETYSSIRKQRLDGLKVNKTTFIMFAVTAVFILSWIPPWVAAILWPPGNPTMSGNIGRMFCRRSFMINTCTNPLFYIGMSTVFRNMTKQTFSKLWKVVRRRRDTNT